MKKKRRKKPTILCPACGETVALPADDCARCGVDLRTGLKRSSSGRFYKGRFNLAGLDRAGWVLKNALQWGACGVAVFMLYVHITAPNEDPAPTALTAKGERLMPLSEIMPQEIKDSVPAYLRKLAEEHPILVQPYILMYEAQETIRRLNEDSLTRREAMSGLAEIYEPAEKTGDHYKKTTPSLRYLLLEEIHQESGLETKSRGGGNP